MIYSKGSQARFGAEIENTITVMLNGSSIAFDQPPIIKDDRTLVPIRAISAAFDYPVDWNDELQQVSIANERKDLSPFPLHRPGGRSVQKNDPSLNRVCEIIIRFDEIYP